MTRAGNGKHPGGRPLKIHTIVDRDADGRPINAGDKIIALTRSVWCPWEDAAASVGVSSRQIRDWRRLGAQARIKLLEGSEQLTDNERTLADFVARLEQAEAEVHAAHLGVITNASKGGLTETKVVETVVDGKVKSKVTTTTTKPPAWTASAWMLERHRPDVYRTRHELTGANGAPLTSQSERAEAIGGWLEGYLAGADQAKIDATKDSVTE